MINDRTHKNILTHLHLKDKCRGRFHYHTLDQLYKACQLCSGCRTKDPIEVKYGVRSIGYVSEEKYNKLPNCVIVFSIEPSYYNDGSPYHSCLCENNRWYVKSFEDGRLEITKNEEEADVFFSDKLVDECMQYIITNKKPWTISIWEYNGNKAVSECVHYPNEHWWNNKNLQPSLMNKSVADWMKEHNEL